MPDAAELRQDFEAAQDRFEQYRASVSTAIEERAAGELSRALDVILPDLVFYEGQACAAGIGLSVLGDDNDEDNDDDKVAATARALTHGLLEQQAARRGSDFLAGFAAMLARANRALSE